MKTTLCRAVPPISGPVRKDKDNNEQNRDPAPDRRPPSQVLMDGIRSIRSISDARCRLRAWHPARPVTQVSQYRSIAHGTGAMGTMGTIGGGNCARANERGSTVAVNSLATPPDSCHFAFGTGIPFHIRSHFRYRSRNAPPSLPTPFLSAGFWVLVLPCLVVIIWWVGVPL